MHLNNDKTTNDFQNGRYLYKYWRSDQILINRQTTFHFCIDVDVPDVTIAVTPLDLQIQLLHHFLIKLFFFLMSFMSEIGLYHPGSYTRWIIYNSHSNVNWCYCVRRKVTWFSITNSQWEMKFFICCHHGIDWKCKLNWLNYRLTCLNICTWYICIIHWLVKNQESTINCNISHRVTMCCMLLNLITVAYLRSTLWRRLLTRSHCCHMLCTSISWVNLILF